MFFKFKILCFFSIVFLAFFTEISYSQLKVKIRKVLDESFITVDPSQYPLMKARIRAELSDTPVKLLKENILILENNKISKPIFVGDFIKDTSSNEIWQMVQWYTRRDGPNLFTNNQSLIVDTFYIFIDSQLSKISGLHNRADLSFVKIFNSSDNAITDIEFKNVDPGSSQDVNVIVKALKGQIDGSGTEGQIWIDSAKVHSSNFRIKWDGWSQDKRPPPLHIWPMMPYFVRIYYEPKDNDYHTDKLTVYYDHGLKQEIMLNGHEFHIQDLANNLKLIYPKGNEIFTPCQQVEIKWDGYIRGMATYIDFSSNKGSSWTNIGLSDDSSFIWTVPNLSTNSGLIRIRQSFSSTQPSLLKVDNTPVSKLAFNYDGSILLAANDAGTITAWNTVTEKSIKNFNLSQPNYPATQIRVTGMSFTKSDSIFAVAYFWLKDYPRKDSIAFFNYQQENPFQRTAIEQGFITQKARFDNKKRFIAFIPDIGMKVKIYSAKDGSFIKDLTYEKPITSFVFNRDLDQAAVSLLDGTIKILNLPDFNVIDSIDYSDFPMILDMSVASNGKFIALASKAPYLTMFSDNRNDICVVNIPSKQVIRRLRRTASDPVGLEFSPISTKLLVGSLADPQISYWDLPVDVSFNSFKGHTGKLTDFAFSPRGSMIATSSASSDNLYLRRFSYAESDETDTSFTIITPSLNIVSLQLTPAYISETVSYNLPAAICVKSDSPVPLSVDSIGLKHGIHFSLKSPLPKDTNIFAGQCLQINLNFTPLDTGEISDSVIIYSCGSSYYLPIHSKGKMRNIRLLSKKFIFEPTCVGSSIEKTFAIAINDDPVPLTINKHEFIQEEYNPFISLTSRDLVYKPGDTIFATIKFEPSRLGLQTRKLEITHSYLPKFSFQVDISGEGIGTNYDLSHYDLRFIPEILQRKISVINNSDNTIFIYDTIFDPVGYFSFVSQLPINIKPHSESEISIIWNNWLGEPTSDVNLKLIAGPCAAEKKITLGLYKGSSNITIPDVFADPKEKATISIDFNNDENHPYKGQRFFEAEITLNPRLFLPQKVTSQYGIGSLIRNEINDDRRIIGFRVEGDFPTSGRLAEIHGIAGLAEIDTSHIRFNKSQLLWGKSVSTKTSPSIFNLINICGNRLVIHGNKILNLKISPNPTFSEINIEFNSTANGLGIIEVLNNLGEIVYESDSITFLEGINHHNLNLTNIKTGMYNLLIKFDDSFAIGKFLIIY